ncbi:MAG: DUF3426 domain-containing protein [Sulfuritalea sp.]|nr:DUF3426 domain-containing protein [Sulfuritalea sp.]
MLTRCPDCATHFRVTAEQLKARSGRVRCGECQHVFNALDSLIEEPTVVLVAPPAAEPAHDEIAPSPPDTAEESATRPEAAMDEFAVPPAPTLEPTPEPAPEPAPEPDPGPMPDVPEQVPALPSETEEASLPEIVPAAPDTDTADDSEAADWSETFPPAPPRRWPWVVGSLLAFAALGLQALIAFRVELAVLWPQTKPSLVALCQLAGCEVGLPTKVGMVGIEASDLHPDSEHPGRLALAATLKNRAPFAQQFPHLELTLTDTADQAIARKVLAPADYLPPATPLAAGMAPNADIVLTVGIDPREMAASGYRLYLFYP